MKDDITSQFYQWMAAHNIKRSEAADMLGVEERSLSTYRSRGLPKKKESRALQIMQAHRQASAPQIDAGDQSTRVAVSFTDEEFRLVEKAATIVGSTTTEFIQKSATFKAKEEIAAAQKTSLSLVAEDPVEYRPDKKSNGGNA